MGNHIYLEIQTFGVKFVKFAGLCGILGPLLALPILLYSVQRAEGFSWFGNWLSDIGGGVFGPSVALTFNLSPILGGIFALIFSLGLFRVLNKPSGRLGAFLFLSASVSLIAIGVFPEPYGLIHYSVSVAFFILSTVSMFYVGASAMDSSDRSLAILSLSLGLISAFALAPTVKAVSEFIGAISVSIWTVFLGIRLLRG